MENPNRSNSHRNDCKTQGCKVISVMALKLCDVEQRSIGTCTLEWWIEMIHWKASWILSKKDIKSNK